MTLHSSTSFPLTRLTRYFSLNGVLILIGCLGVVKAAMVITALSEQQLMPRSVMTTVDSQASDPIDEIAPDESKFVPWPTILPEPAAGPEGEEMSADVASAEDDVTTLTPGQVTALKQLAARRRALDEREQLLDIRAELNGQTEARLDKQIEQLSSLKEQIEALVTTLDETEEIKLARLVKIYETMKPKAAAEIFNRLDMSVLIHVVERMKEAKSAVVLGKMNPAIAKRVTTELARKKERPLLDNNI